MAKVSYVHFGSSDREPKEYGISFVVDDGKGGEVKGKLYADVDPALRDVVMNAAQASLDAFTGQLPVDLDPGAVTTALMKARNARQEAEVAETKRVEAEKARNAAADEAEQTRAAIAAAKAKHDAEMASAKEKHDAEVTARAKALADLDAQLAAKAAKLSEELTKPEEPIA